MSQIIDLTSGEGCVTCHAWNKDRSKVAFSPLNSSEVHIWAKSGNSYAKECVLTEHDGTVTGIDWAPETNRIVTCSQDRNAYVFEWKDNVWKPTLVILRLDRGCTMVKWSPDENKFAVGSAAKTVSVCYFEEDNDWWVSKHIRKGIRSTVLSLAWHPNSVLLAAGSSDFKCRIFSTFIKGVDKPPQNNPFGTKVRMFGNPVAEYESQPGGWVHAVTFSPSGNLLGFATHDSCVCVADISSGEEVEAAVVKLDMLPLRSLVFMDESSLVGGGHDRTPILLQGAGDSWKFVKKLEEKKAAGPAKGGSAMSMWKAKDTMGTTTNATEMTTKHQNCISCLIACDGDGSSFSKYSTTGMDGKLIVWNFAA